MLKRRKLIRQYSLKMEKVGKQYMYHLLGMFKGRRNGISGFKKIHKEGMMMGIRCLRIKVSTEQMKKLHQ